MKCKKGATTVVLGGCLGSRSLGLRAPACHRNWSARQIWRRQQVSKLTKRRNKAPSLQVSHWLGPALCAARLPRCRWWWDGRLAVRWWSGHRQAPAQTETAGSAPTRLQSAPTRLQSALSSRSWAPCVLCQTEGTIYPNSGQAQTAAGTLTQVLVDTVPEFPQPGGTAPLLGQQSNSGFEAGRGAEGWVLAWLRWALLLFILISSGTYILRPTFIRGDPSARINVLVLWLMDWLMDRAYCPLKKSLSQRLRVATGPWPWATPLMDNLADLMEWPLSTLSATYNADEEPFILKALCRFAHLLFLGLACLFIYAWKKLWGGSPSPAE